MPEKDTKKTIGQQIDDLLPKGDIKKALVIVIKHVLGFEKKLMDRLGEISTAMSQSHSRAMARVEESISTRLEGVVKGKDGYTPIKGKDYFDGEKGRPGLKGKDGSPDNGEQIIEKINKDDSKKKIKKEKIEGWDELEDKIKTAEINTRGFLRPSGNFMYMEDLSSQTDGLTKTFTVPAHQRALFVAGSDFPNILFPNNGFSKTAKTITLTMDNAPSEGSQLGFAYVI
jgi:hypothetical protein